MLMFLRMKKKKESFWKEYKQTTITIFGVIVLIIMIFALLAPISGNKPFVTKLLEKLSNKPFNPDDHVCIECLDDDETNDVYSFGSNEGVTCNTKCLDHRDKTNEELEIDYCNDCESWHWEDNYQCKKGLKTYTASKEMCQLLNAKLTGKSCESSCKCEAYSETNYITSYGGEEPVIRYDCTQARPKTKPIEINLKEERCVEHSSDNIIPKGNAFECSDINYQINHYKETGDNGISDAWQQRYDQYCCTKKEELTPCEKGDPNFIEETRCFQEHGYGINCRNVTVNKYVDVPNSECSTQEAPEGYIYPVGCIRQTLVNKTNCDQAWECVDERTICREKTEEEKECEAWLQLGFEKCEKLTADEIHQKYSSAIGQGKIVWGVEFDGDDENIDMGEI